MSSLQFDHRLSPEVRQAAKRRSFREALYQVRAERMAQGPRLGGCRLIIPAAVGWYNRDGVRQWQRWGMRWDEEKYIWWRDVRWAHPVNGQRYSAQAWLEAATKRFFEFWPGLKGEEQ